MAVKDLERRNVTRTGVALASETGIVQLSTNQIRTDGGTQPRSGLNADTVADYVVDMERGDRFPPLDVMYDGQSYWLFDGFHRLAALRALGKQAVEVWIHQGDLSDAQWQSYAVNKGHGLRRTNADKERSVKAALRHPKAAHMSDSAIAAHVGVSDKTVAKYRAELEASSEIPKIEQRTVTRGGSTFVMDTGKIGQKLPALTLDETIAFVWQMIKRHARDADTATRLAWLNKPNINFHVEAQRADKPKLDETTLRVAIKGVTAELQGKLAHEQRKQQRREEQGWSAPPQEEALPELYADGIHQYCHDSQGRRYNIHQAPAGGWYGNTYACLVHWATERLDSLDAVRRAIRDGRVSEAAYIRWQHLGALRGTPAHDVNFKASLEQADTEMLREALIGLPVEGNKTRIERITARIRKLAREREEEAYAAQQVRDMLDGKPYGPAPAARLDELDVVDRELAPWPLDAEAAIGQELDDPIVAAGRRPPAAGRSSEPEVAAGSDSGASSQQLTASSHLVTLTIPRTIAEHLHAALGLRALRYHLSSAEAEQLNAALEQALQ